MVILLILVGIVLAVCYLIRPRVCCRLFPPCVLPAEASTGTFFAPDDPVPEGPDVAWVEIVPGEVSVEPGTVAEFTLRAVLRDEAGFVIPEVVGVPITWEIPGPLTQVGTGPSSVTVSVVGGNPTEQLAQVTAKAGSSPPVSSRPATVRVTPPATVDHVSAPHVNKATPSVSLADAELTNNSLLRDRVFSFIREHALGDVKAPGSDWGSVVILSPSRAPAVEILSVVTGGPQMNIAPTVTTLSLLDVPLTIWLAVPPADLAGGLTLTDVGNRAMTDRLWTNDAYARARVGVRLVLNSDPVELTGDVLNAVNQACSTQEFELLPVIDRDAMNVYYVGSSGPEGMSGWAIDAESTKETPVACLGWVSQRSLSVMAHELGHGMGLTDVYTYPESPFGATNVMGYLHSVHLAPSDHLTVGQVFGVVLAKGSWLLRRPLVTWSGVDCSAVKCPVVTFDIPGTPRP